MDQLGLKQPVLVGWSMGCGELLSYVEQFGEDNISGLVLVDGLIPANKNLEVEKIGGQRPIGLPEFLEAYRGALVS